VELGGPGIEEIGLGLVYYVVFVLSVTLHEAAHAWAAKRGGDPTAYLGGQVSIDPRPHMRREPFGMVILPLLGVLTTGWPFGWASAPYDPGWAHRHPRRAGWMSLAGPAANLGLVLVAALLIHLGTFAGVFASPPSISFSHVTEGVGALGTALALGVSVLFSMNLVLFLLNMIPLPPLDGSGALLLLVPEHLTSRYQELLRQPALAWAGILLVLYFFGAVFRPVFLCAVNLLYPFASYG
jgi:Zn-dependent protease